MLNRRDWLRLTSCGVLGLSQAPWFSALADEAKTARTNRACILLWMPGGPTQTDTFDLKPGHKNGGPFKPIDTAAPGVQISEHLPQLAQQGKHLSVIRSMSTKEGDHTRATYLLRTGNLPQGPIKYPALGAVLAKELAQEGVDLPSYVSVSPNRILSPAAWGPGFLGPQYAPLIVGSQAGRNQADALKVKNVALPESVSTAQADQRLSLLSGLEADFGRNYPSVPTQSHQAAYLAAARMMKSPAMKAFQLEEEADALRDRYGRNQFGQACLLARRLIERGVSFVEISLNGADNNQGIGWDTHANNFDEVKKLSGVLDPAWATLLADLQDHGILETTTVVWMGEFGRTPVINDNTGRDHFPNAWSVALSGGIRGGQVIGKTNDSGMEVADRPVDVSDLLATIARSVGVDPMTQNISNVGRPIRIAPPEASVIEELVTTKAT